VNGTVIGLTYTLANNKGEIMDLTQLRNALGKDHKYSTGYEDEEKVEIVSVEADNGLVKFVFKDGKCIKVHTEPCTGYSKRKKNAD